VAKSAPPQGRLTRFLRYGALHKGLLGGSPGWRAVFFAMYGGRMLRKLTGKVPEVVATEKIEPGHLLQLEAIKPLSRRRKKAAARALRARSRPK
jgi:hypothetical protein